MNTASFRTTALIATGSALLLLLSGCFNLGVLQPDNTTKFDGGEIVRNAEENRLQILFDEIPDADTRDALKSNGFRWSPRNKAWQRQLTQNAEYAARRVLGL